MDASATIAVSIVEDETEIREGLAALIASTRGFRCAGAFAAMEPALAGIGTDVPDVCLVDIGLPGMSGIDGIPILRVRWPAMALLVLSVYQDDRRIFDALCSGAVGYLVKNTPPAKLIDALRDTAAGGSPVSPSIARRVIALFRDIRPPERADYGLTPHEVRLLKLVAEGHHYKTAAAELGVTPSTVSFHLQQIYRKLEVHSKSEAVVRALRGGLIS